MSRLGTAFRSFFAALGSPEAASRIATAIDTPQTPAIETVAAEPEPAPQPVRSDAVTLLAALQRDGRLVDFLMEPIDGFTDEQVGAAVRDVHRGCRQTIERLVPVVPLLDAEEGQTVSAASHSPAKIRSVGGRADSGELLHPGWKVAVVSLPEFTGSADEAAIVMPAEIQG